MFRLFLFLIIFSSCNTSQKKEEVFVDEKPQSENDVLSKSMLGEKYKTLMLEEGIVRSEDEFYLADSLNQFHIINLKNNYVLLQPRGWPFCGSAPCGFYILKDNVTSLHVWDYYEYKQVLIEESNQDTIVFVQQKVAGQCSGSVTVTAVPFYGRLLIVGRIFNEHFIQDEEHHTKFIKHCIKSPKDFVSNIVYDNLSLDDLSLDFRPAEISSNQWWTHFNQCEFFGYSYYQSDSIWRVDHLSSIPSEIEKARKAFIKPKEFSQFPVEKWNGENYFMGDYEPTDKGFQYYTLDGFAFTDLNKFEDFNNDGFIDRKVKFTKLDYEKSHFYIRDVYTYSDEEYKKEFEECRSKEIRGEGYITRFQENGLLYLLPSYEETDLWNF